MNHTSPSPIRLAISASASKLLPSLRKGLTVIAVDSTELLHPVKTALVQAMLSCSHSLPVPMPRCDVVRDMVVGSPRYLDHFKALHSDSDFVEGIASYDPVYVASSTPIDWTGPGGLMLLNQNLKGESKTALVLIQHGDIRTNGLGVEGLVAMQRKARDEKTCVVMVTELEKSDRATFCRMTDEFFEVSECESDPGWDNAFIIDCVELSRVPGLGQGKVMCNFKLTDRRYEFGFNPFVSEHRDVRLMAILKAQGMTLKEIGSLLYKDKSNVSRDLSGIAPLEKTVFTKADLICWLEACGIDTETVRKELVAFGECAEKNKVVALPVKNERNERNERNDTPRKRR